MRVRKQTAPGTLDPLDPGGDRVFGQGISNFWINVPDGPGQVAGTRLKLWQGQWFLNIPDGTAYKTKVLGKYTGSTRDIEIQNRILTGPGVNGLAAYASQLNPQTRKWNVQATINTAYGQFQLTGPF